MVFDKPNDWLTDYDRSARIFVSSWFFLVAVVAAATVTVAVFVTAAVAAATVFVGR